MAQVLTGRPIAPGYAEGVAVVYDAERVLEVPHRKISTDGVDLEKRRLAEAVDKARRDLERVEQRVLTEFGAGDSAIFGAHLAVLHDPRVVDEIEHRIVEERVNAEAAVAAVISERADELHAVDDQYLRERSHDIRDVGRRVIACLMAVHSNALRRLRTGSVVVARELLPSETIELDRTNVAAIVTEQGSDNSHAAILARSLGIPAVTGVADATARIRSGQRVLVDGESGEVSVRVDAERLRQFSARKLAYDARASTEAAAEAERCVTADGAAIELHANIGRPDEAAGEREVDILLPMVLGAEDLSRAIDAIAAAAARAGLARRPRVGAMIETPAALFGLDEILERADFVSIGTNDLTQFMLAADRNSFRSADSYLVLHPAVLRATASVLERAAEAGRPASICGEAAGDPHIALLLVGLAVRRLSMSPSRGAKVRYAIRRLSLADARRAAEEALAATSPAQVSALVRELVGGESPAR